MTQPATKPTSLPPLERLAPEMRAVLDRLMAEDGPLPDPTLLPAAEGRALSEALNRRWNNGEPAMARVWRCKTPLDGMANIYLPETDRGRDAILLIHGGGWAFCSAATHDGAARQLAQETGAAVMSFDYRLAPEHPYPAALNDCLTIWAARERLLPGRRWSIAGDSAGANLAVATMLRLQGHDLPAAGLLFYGVYGADFDSASYREIAYGPGLTRAKMQRYWDWYAPPASRLADPCLTPGLAPDAALAALPPLYLNAAELDPLRSDSEGFAARLAGLGRADVFDLVPGVIHGFMQMSLWLPQSAAAYRRAAEVNARLV